jgi:thymidylate kinase
MIDVFPASAWPNYYPDLGEALGRLEEQPDMPPAFSAEDRLLMLAAEALAGRPLEKVAVKAELLLSQPGVLERLRDRAGAHGEETLARLVAEPGALAGVARRGRLPYPAALRTALHSRRGRAALRTRLTGRIRAARPNRHRGPGALIALSGIDGSGKTTLAAAIADHLESRGVAATPAWARLASESRLLDRLAVPVKGIVGGRGSVADPEAAESPNLRAAPAAPVGQRGGVTGRAWVTIVALVNARSLRAIARARRQGGWLVSDRWLIDSLVDLRVRYGRHPIAESILARAVPRADLSLVLEIDAATAERRKPGDQSRRVLADMSSLYAEVARGELVRIDARHPRGDVEREALAHVDALLERRGLRNLPPKITG